jgi:3-phenylpropionate/cinnamic acid dioxygenase small subunit
MTFTFPEADTSVRDEPTHDLQSITQFIYREARLADEHDYDGWEQLWTDDALYWVPVPGSREDPMKHVSVIYDNRNRIRTRLTQLRTGKRWAQSPASNLRRVISNIEVLETHDTEVVVGANFVLFEAKERFVETWAGRVTYKIRSVDGELRLAGKTVDLVNAGQPLSSMGFLI